MEGFRDFLNIELPFFSGGVKTWSIFAICIGMVSILVMIFLARRGLKRRRNREIAMNAPLIEFTTDEAIASHEIHAITKLSFIESDNIPTEKDATMIEVEVSLNGASARKCCNNSENAVENTAKLTEKSKLHI